MRFTIIFSLIFVSNNTLLLFGQENNESDSHLIKVLDSIQNESPPMAILEKYGFESFTNKSLAALSNHKWNHIAVLAKWELESRQVINKDRNRALSRFAGFVEGRLRVEIPLWWSSTLQAGEFDNESNSFYFKNSAKALPFLDWLDQSNCWKSNSISYWNKTSSPQIILEHGAKISISDEALKSWQSSIFLAKDDRFYFVLLFDISGRSSNLFCISIDTGTLIWKANTWGDGVVGFSGIPDRFGHIVELVISPKRVTVFGCSNGTIYVESFEKKSGKSLMRFCPHIY